MNEIGPIRLSEKDIKNLGIISDTLLKMYRKEYKMFDNELLNTFFGGVAVMADEMDGTGLIAVKYIEHMKKFAEHWK